MTIRGFFFESPLFIFGVNKYKRKAFWRPKI